MARLIPATERMVRARALIQKAREVTIPADTEMYDLAFVAQVKDILQQARDLIKFIPYSVSATKEMKAEVAQIFKEAELAEKEILHKS
jgi:ABC-type Na+ transport system ATPase subunit NatA